MLKDCLVIHSASNSTKSHRSKIDIGIVWTPPPKGDIERHSHSLQCYFMIMLV